MYKAAFIIIGNEILSGRTQDKNVNYLAKWLEGFGHDLNEVRIIPDEKARILQTLEDLKKTADIIFTSGGIGPTHDDITAETIAEFCKVPLTIRDDARQILLDYYGPENLTEARLRMARIPGDAKLIENPVTRAPGFYLNDIYVLAGIPKVQQAMLASIAHLFDHNGSKIHTKSIRTNSPESELAAFMQKLDEDYEDLSVGSYPYNVNERYAVRIVLRTRDEALMEEAIVKVITTLEERSVAYAFEDV